MRYAQNTDVPADRSRAEIERTLTRYGANGFMYGWENGAGGEVRAVIGFRLENRSIRFELAMPDREDPEFTLTPAGRRTRGPEAARAAWEQAGRQRWRALSLVVKAKLEAVSAGIATFEEEFLAYIVLPDGRTVGQHAIPAIEAAYLTGRVRGLLPAVAEESS